MPNARVCLMTMSVEEKDDTGSVRKFSVSELMTKLLSSMSSEGE